MNPKISVIMPVYNTAEYVEAAIKSILEQTYTDFEFIIVDDASTDGSDAIIESYAQKDERIHFFRNECNKGISFTRNRLISLAKCDYIATQDSDDVSRTDRLAKEIQILEKNINCAAVSSETDIIDDTGNIIGYRAYSGAIASVILKRSPLANPASMFRKKIFEELGGYREGLNYGEDYDLWIRMYAAGYQLQVIHEPLLQLRIRSGQTKSTKLKATIKNTIALQKEAIKKYGIVPSWSDKIYLWAEQLLYFLPSFLIMWLFKKISYKKWR